MRKVFTTKMIKLFINTLCIFIPTEGVRKKARATLWKLVHRSLEYNTPHHLKDLREQSGAKWLELKELFAGKRCFIIGSAPSVKKLDLTKLENEYTFTCNKAFLLQELGLKKSTFYTVADEKFYDDFQKEIDANWAEYFFISTKIPWDIAVKNLFYFKSSGVFMELGYFQLDMQQPLARSTTVILEILQIAIYLGFTELIFIGVDLTFSPQNLHFYQSSAVETARTARTDSIEKMLKSFEYAAAFLSQRGIKLYNASPEGILDCMPRVKYEDLF